MDYCYESYTIYKIEYHFVWVTKYRYELLEGKIGLRVRDLVRQTCEAFEAEILIKTMFDFIDLFQTKTSYETLNQLLKRISRNQHELLWVLGRPELLLHNNLALEVRMAENAEMLLQV